METVNQENNVVQEEPKKDTFTQDEVNTIINDRLKRERAKYEDYEALKAKATKFDEMEEANKTELQKANEKASALEAELTALKSANSIREIRDRVSTETGIPSSLLTAETEEECQEQAKAILAYAKPSSYPVVKDGGELQSIGKPNTRDQFNEWATKAFS